MSSKTTSDREVRLIEAMRRCIATQGYSATSLSHVIAETGGSRRNIYAAFGSKAGLLNAVIDRIAADVVDASFNVPDDRLPARDWLIAVGTATMKAVLDPEIIALLRAVVANEVTDPDAVRRIWMAGPARFQSQLGSWIESRNQDGTFQLEDTQFAARTFLDMLRGSFQMEMLIGKRDDFSDAEITAHVTSVVEFFLKAAEPRT